MTGPDIGSVIEADVARRIASPEGVTVRVVCEDPNLARQAAPLIAETLYPGRSYGRILLAEADGDGWLVTVEDRGPIRHTNRSGIPAPR